MPTIQTTDKSIIPFKVQELVGIISNKKRMSDTDAMMYLYNSQLYEEMADPAKKLWYNSGIELYRLLEEEKSSNRRAQSDENKRQFLIFCVEQYRWRHKQTAVSALDKLISSGTDKFITDNFEVLHTQSPQYIIDQIDRHIKLRK